MQKTEIKYYCDVCKREISGFMFGLQYDYRFYSQKVPNGDFKTEDFGDEMRHFCYPCSRKIVEYLGLTVAGVNAILSSEVKENA